MSQLRPQTLCHNQPPRLKLDQPNRLLKYLPLKPPLSPKKIPKRETTETDLTRGLTTRTEPSTSEKRTTAKEVTETIETIETTEITETIETTTDTPATTATTTTDLTRTTKMPIESTTTTNPSTKRSKFPSSSSTTEATPPSKTATARSTREESSTTGRSMIWRTRDSLLSKENLNPTTPPRVKATTERSTGTRTRRIITMANDQ